MPPTKHMTGDVFRGNLLDGFFNLVGAMTGQSILLVGMMTEAVATPWLSDRDIALQNVRYVLNACGGLDEDFVPAPGGFIQRRAAQVLAEAVDLLERIVGEPTSERGTSEAEGRSQAQPTSERGTSEAEGRNQAQPGLLEAIGEGTFGIMRRPATGGRGLDGVAAHEPDYYNPATDLLETPAGEGSS
jgi:beta-lysine 5,6-aminomutase alpha subunit